MSENQEDNIIHLSQIRDKDDEITDEDFRIAIRALFGPNEIRGHKPE